MRELPLKTFVSLLRKGLSKQRCQEELGAAVCPEGEQGSPPALSRLRDSCSQPLPAPEAQMLFPSAFTCSPLVRSAGLFVCHKTGVWKCRKQHSAILPTQALPSLGRDLPVLPPSLELLCCRHLQLALLPRAPQRLAPSSNSPCTHCRCWEASAKSPGSFGSVQSCLPWAEQTKNASPPCCNIVKIFIDTWCANKKVKVTSVLSLFTDKGGRWESLGCLSSFLPKLPTKSATWRCEAFQQPRGWKL